MCYVTFSLGVTAEELRENIGSKSAISLKREPVDPRGVFRGEAGAMPPIVDLVDFLRKNGFVGTVLSTRSVLWTSHMPKMLRRPGIRPGSR